MHKLGIVLLSFLVGGGQYSGITRNGATASSPAPCVAPTMDHRWAAWNPANTCTGGCVTGNDVPTMPDLVASNSATGSGTYTSNALGSFAGIQETGGYYHITGLPTPTQISYYAVLNINSQGGPLTGVQAAGQGSPEWVVTSVGGQYLNSNNVAAIGSASTNVSATTYVTVGMTYDTGSGALRFYSCSVGSCTTVGSATNVKSFSGGANQILQSYPDGSFKGYLIEIATLNGIMNTTQLAAWSQCKYGI
jgi:hypothetical protein